jgi:type I restriction-modification system DNA methylase subunit
VALKKSELYSSLWQSCDELRGGMDASQYKDYVLVLLFVKYVSDRFAGQPFAAITVPEGASFADMVALKGKSDIGDQINKKILGPLALANNLADMPDFNDPTKLGTGKEMVERLTNLIGIFENPSLDFSRNRADGDDLLGDAYEYLMRHFATESGKSKGQFYTPSEVSRIMAQAIGIRQAKTSNKTTVYDPTCGSGSLLLKVGDEARHGKDVKVTLEGQEKDSATAGLARMNMILHDYATADIKQGNTIVNPLFKDGNALKTYDYVVANPPFSDKRWSTGIDPATDEHQRFQHFGVPPAKQSVGIGFGWAEVGLHLHLIDSQTYDYNSASELLPSPVFKPLLELFELKTPPKYINDGGLAFNDTINPFSGATDFQVRQRELAWFAAHKTKYYVEKMGGIIRRLTADSSHSGLFRELNRQIRENTSAKRAAQP